MTAGSFEGQYVWSPAADDRQLARACMDVRTGRYFRAHEVLKETRGDFEVRAHRSLVLASEAADSDLAERWWAEEPGPEAALLWARVAMLRALRAADAGDPHQVALARIARTAGERAAHLLPADPTPWVAQLSLARLDRPQDPAPRGLLTAPSGPWYLFAHILRLDPWHREAHHRFLSFFFTRYGGSSSESWDVAAFLSQRAPAAHRSGCCRWWRWSRTTTRPPCSRTTPGSSPSGSPRRRASTATGFRGLPNTVSRRCWIWRIWRMRCSWRNANSRRGKSSRRWGPMPRVCPGAPLAIPRSN